MLMDGGKAVGSTSGNIGKTGEKSGMLVALVDDNASVRRGISRLLHASGYRVETYASGESFLARQDPEALSCVILDLHMSGLSGAEVRQHMRLGGVRTPVIFITAHHPADTQEILQQAYDVPCLRKPFTGGALIDLIERTIESPGMAAQSIGALGAA